MEINFTKLGSAPVIKLSFLSPNPDFGTVLWDIGADCPQTSLLFRQSAPCYDWTIGGVLLAAGRRQGSGRYKGLALSCLLLVPVTVAPGSGSCFQVFRFLGIFFPSSHFQNQPHCTVSEIPAPGGQCPLFRGLGRGSAHSSSDL